MKKIPKEDIEEFYDEGASLRWPIIFTIISTLIVVLVSEYLFQVPSRLVNRIDPLPPLISRDHSPAILPRPVSPQASQSTQSGSCPLEYAPVCGIDSKTYSNACMAGLSSTRIKYPGSCESRISDTSTTGSLASSWQSQFDPISYNIYKNNTFGYSLALPRYAYYQWYGTKWGSVHTLAIALSASGVTDSSTAPVRLYFYTTPPQIPPSSDSLALSGGTLYIDTSSTEPKILKIIDTIRKSAQ
jgi:hypothetical protein